MRWKNDFSWVSREEGFSIVPNGVKRKIRENKNKDFDPNLNLFGFKIL